jgi:hypothetical protein
LKEVARLNIKVTTRLTNRGIELSIGTGDPEKPLTPDPNADQTNPRGNYVYAHMDSSGKIFYVGKGVKRRAWSTDRHLLWDRYVDRHLGGQYRVCILRDSLSPREAEDLEADWIAQCSADLVNWLNMGRDLDYDAVQRFHALRNANRSLIQRTKAVERADPEKAVCEYLRAVNAISEYASISFEKGLVGQLLDEEAQEFGRGGDLEALDRLTLCLTRLGRAEEAARHVQGYFDQYPIDRQFRTAERIEKRVAKALSRKGKADTEASGQRD